MFTKLSVEKYGFFTTYDNQNYILSYLHPETPYRSLFLCYEVGQGKAYAAACLAHIYCLEGFKTLYLSNSINSIKSFQNEYKSVVNDNRSESLEHNINVMSFTKFYRQKLDMNYGLVILDEVHNLRENANRYKVIKNKLDLMINSKLLIISATPMVDSVDEMQSILKLTNEDTKILFSASRERPEINYVGEKVNGEILFLSQLKGKQLEYYNSLNSSNDTVYT
ncbi:DEAD/DEAH box helicase family protein, partial [Bartonella sp. CL26QHWL]|uniref:DEAD/DEAH box helicase family protein n=1 Tax=Bartonella sp. CL26QHWL TaxID=3243520 RepID=UPI0035CF14D0